VVNRFRGDPALFEDGVRFLERRSGRPVLGVVPERPDIRLPAEDSLELGRLGSAGDGAVLDVAVIRLERISNFDELQPLAGEPGVRLRLAGGPDELGRPDLVILPGSKTTVHDLGRLRASGLADAILGAHAGGAAVLGICGGYQMLGRRIDDPDGVEAAGGAPGLSLLPIVTRFGARKLTIQRRGRVLPRYGLLAGAGGLEVRGYEIHAGRVGGEERPALDLGERLEGCVSEEGWVVGSSIQGLLAGRALRRAVLESLARRRGVVLPPPAPEPPDPFEALADARERCLDVGRLDRIVGLTS
jgi:adenosylcobyric acid synthase